MYSELYKSSILLEKDLLLLKTAKEWSSVYEEVVKSSLSFIL